MTMKPVTLLPLDSTDPRWADLSTMKRLTCANHPGMWYLTKNPWTRAIHIYKRDPNMEPGAMECKCAFSDLRLVEEA